MPGNRRECGECGFEFTRPDACSRHKRRYHKVPALPGSCPACSKKFNKYGMDTHWRRAHPALLEKLRNGELCKLVAAVKQSPMRILATATACNEGMTGPLTHLIQSLASKIQKPVLFAGLSPQKRWGDNGYEQNTTIFDAGLSQGLAYIFSSEAVLNTIIQYCLWSNTLGQDEDEDGTPFYFLRSPPQHQPVANNFDGLILVTFLYPRGDIFNSSLKDFQDRQDLAKYLFPHLQSLWELLLSEPSRLCLSTLSAQVRHSVVEAFIEASRGAPSTYRALAAAENMLDEESPLHLRLEITLKRSQVLRSAGDHDQSDVLIEDTLRDLTITNQKTHCLHGRLLFSRAENAIHRKEYGRALSFLSDWQARDENNPSLLELRLTRLKFTAMARVLRYRGEFESSKENFNNCLMPACTESSRYHIMHHLGDVYCELGEETHAEILLSNHIMDHRKQGKLKCKSFRRLLLPLAEAYTRQRRFEEARKTLFELICIFDELKSLDVSDQLGHVRSILGLVRIACDSFQWHEALMNCNRAITLTKQYRTFSDENYYIGIALLFRTITLFKLERFRESQDALVQARACDQGPRHFMPGMGTYVLHRLQLDVESLQWPGHSQGCEKVNFT